MERKHTDTKESHIVEIANLKKNIKELKFFVKI